MGKLGKETKKLLLAITIICLVSFLLAVGISFLLTKNFQHELLLHDYGVSGYQLNHEDELQISAFTSLPNENDIERGREALASIGYDETTSMRFLPAVQTYRNQTVLSIFALLVFLFGAIYLSLFLYLQRQHKAFSNAENTIRQFLDGNTTSRIECSQAGDWYSLFHAINEMATILSAHAENQRQTKEFLQDIISDVSHQIKTPLSALKMYHEILMQDVLERFETWAEREHKTITLSGKEDVILSCDALWVSEAIGNIIKNALEHTETGGHIGVEWSQSPLMTQIEISDDGKGIHPEDLYNIFKRFYRSRLSSDVHGIGLGLPLAKSIVEAHGGTISVTSTPGMGTTFTLNFINLTNE